MARNLVAAMTTEFDPAQYHDEYRAALQKVIEAKVAGEEVERPAEAPKAAGKLVDLMSVLEASVAAARATRTDAKAEPASRAKAPAKAEAPAAAASARRKGRAAAAEADEEAAPVRRRKSA
jgi:DNA end-binding protein Ku